MSINKYTTQEVLNKVYTDESDNTISLQAQTAKETLNAVLSSGENSLNVSLAGSNTITGDVTISGDLIVNGTSGNAYDEIVNGDLHVKSDNGDSANAFLVEKNDGTDVFTVNTSNSVVTASGDVKLSGNDKNISWGGDAHNMIYGNSSSDYLKFQANNQLKLTLNSTGAIFENGNVGIGLADPNSIFMVGGSTASGGDISVANTDTTLVATNHLGSILFKGKDDSESSYGIGAKIVAICTEDWNEATSEGTSLNFYTTANGASSNTLNMVLDGNSRISLGNNDNGGTTGDDGTTGNTIFGMYAGLSIQDTGNNNNAFGHAALNKLTTGDYNVGIGNMSGFYNTTGSQNVYMGYGAGWGANGYSNSNNVGIGYRSLRFIRTGGENVSIGSTSMEDNQTGTGNISIGMETLMNLTSGSNNVAIGKASMNGANVNPSSSTAVGYASARYARGSNNVAFGFSALRGDSGGAFVGTNNIAIGYEAMDALEVGEEYNIAIGSGAIGAMQEGSAGGDVDHNIAIGLDAFKGGDLASNDRQVQGNIAIGSYALDGTTDNATTGQVAIGHSALTDVTSGTGNVAVGYEAGTNLTTGSLNTFVGYLSGHGADGTALIGTYNTCIGEESGYALQGSATSNNLFGQGAGSNITTGHNNIMMGRFVQASAATVSNEIAIGHQITGKGANTVTLGNSDVNKLYLGDFDLFQNNQNHVANTMSSPYYHFDGTNDYITLGDDDKLHFNKNLSISLWIKCNESTIATGGEVLLAKYDGNGNKREYSLYFTEEEKLEFAISPDGNDNAIGRTTPVLSNLDKWNHIVLVWDGDAQTIKIYINGVDQTLTGSGTIPTTTANLSAPFVIGAGSTYADNFHGDIASVKIFNKSLSVTEIKNLHSGDSVPYKYQGADNTHRITSGTVTAFNAASGNVAAQSTTGVTFTTSNWGSVSHTYSSTLEKGKLYRITFTGLSPTGPTGCAPRMGINTSSDSNAEEIATSGNWIGTPAGYTAIPYAFRGSYDSESNTWSAVNYGGYWVGKGTENCFTWKNFNTAGTTTVTNFDIREVGCVAEFDGTGVSSNKWLDKSGNNLHGTPGDGSDATKNPTVANAPSGDDGLVYEEGTWTPIFKSGNNVLTIPGTATYKRVGNMVSVFFGAVDVSTSGTTSGTQFQIQEFPYTAPATKQWVGSLVEYGGGITFEGEGTPYIVIGSGTTANLYQRNDAQTLQHADITGTGANSYFSFQITYEID